MSDPRTGTRDRLIDAYCDLVAASGARSATLDAVAARAGVSKGGLLYHFGSKDALLSGVLDRLRRLAALDTEAMRAAPEGAAQYYVRTSVVAAAGGGDTMDKDVITVLRLAQEGEQRAVEAYREVSENWREALEEQLGDRTLSRVVQLVGDGLWMNSSMHVPVDDLDEVVERLEAVIGARHAASGG